MYELWDSFITTAIKWDFMAILYSLIAGFILGVVGWLTGWFRTIRHSFKWFKSYKQYLKSLEDECSFLIVIGKRKGFTLKDVYVELEITPSDLMPSGMNTADDLQRSYILVGGPGAGKSTYVKKLVLDNLLNTKSNNPLAKHSIPVYIKLKDYHPEDNLETFIGNKLAKFGFPNSEQLVENLLTNRYGLFVLDGLDEVRPNIRSEVYRRINQFYKNFFISGPAPRLIVTCRKEAYRKIPLDIYKINEVKPLNDSLIAEFAEKWPPGYPEGKSAETFVSDLGSAEHIKELTRAPLLLVGGLMLYTESTLGVPDEKIEYLKQIGRWLVTDWASAQGHPQDPQRKVFDPILARLAYHMHEQTLHELSKVTTVSLLEKWLPDYGVQSKSAGSFLDNLITKTGILVTDSPASVIFAQFSLQEYFASKVVIKKSAETQLTEYIQSDWWREVLLLGVAQEDAPDPIFKVLFEEVPLLAVSAVAEHPTPSISWQEQAVTQILTAIENKSNGAGSAAAILLRKLSENPEKLLLTAFEEKLQQPDVSSAVLEALATSGTVAANEVLKKYPMCWEPISKEASWLSSKFEEMLLEMIKSGTDFQFNKAIDLLFSKFSSTLQAQLIGLLPKISPDRASEVALRILFVENNNPIKKGYIYLVNDLTSYITGRTELISYKAETGPITNIFALPRTFGAFHFMEFFPAFGIDREDICVNASLVIHMLQNDHHMDKAKITTIIETGLSWVIEGNYHFSIFACCLLSAIIAFPAFQNYPVLIWYGLLIFNAIIYSHIGYDSGQANVVFILTFFFGFHLHDVWKIMSLDLPNSDILFSNLLDLAILNIMLALTFHLGADWTPVRKPSKVLYLAMAIFTMFLIKYSHPFLDEKVITMIKIGFVCIGLYLSFVTIYYLTKSYRLKHSLRQAIITLNYEISAARAEMSR